MAKAKVDAQPVLEPSDPEYYDGEEAVDTVIAPKPEEPKKPSHNPVVRQMAEDFGFSETEIDAKDPDQLAELVLAIRKREVAQQKQFATQTAQEQDRARVKEPVKEQEPDELAGLEDFDPKIVALLRKQHEEIKTLKKTNGEIVEREQHRERRTLDDVIDGAFDSLAEYEGVFGSGSVRELEDKALVHRRKAALTAAISSGLSLKDASPRKVAKAVREAAEMLFGPPKAKQAKVEESAYGLTEGNSEYVQKPVRPRGPDGKFLNDEVVQSVARDAEWATTLQRPTHRAGAKEPKGFNKAVAGVTALFSEQGRGPDGAESGHVDKDDFPV